MSTKKTSVNKMVKIAVLSALAFVLMKLEIPLWFAPPFYKIDLSEVVVLIGAFALGPSSGVLIEALKVLLKLLITGTDTAFVGDIANFLIGASFILPASIYYWKQKTKKRAITGMLWGTLSMTLVGAFMNAWVLLPAYSYFYQLPIDQIVAMGAAVNSAVTSVWTLVLLCVVPFNLLKGAVTSVIVAFLYKRISPILHK